MISVFIPSPTPFEKNSENSFILEETGFPKDYADRADYADCTDYAIYTDLTELWPLSLSSNFWTDKCSHVGIVSDAGNKLMKIVTGVRLILVWNLLVLPATVQFDQINDVEESDKE